MILFVYVLSDPTNIFQQSMSVRRLEIGSQSLFLLFPAGAKILLPSSSAHKELRFPNTINGPCSVCISCPSLTNTNISEKMHSNFNPKIGTCFLIPGPTWVPVRVEVGLSQSGDRPLFGKRGKLGARGLILPTGVVFCAHTMNKGLEATKNEPKMAQ